ncbi:MAG: MFS transporter [Anaerolineales bacterium]
MSKSTDTASKNPVRRVFALRDFRLLVGGTATSNLGDQFYLIATPWLVLQMTNDPLVLGLVIALGGIPRAVFMLIGGALTDRFSPRAILIASDVLRLMITAFLALVVFTGTVQMWMVYMVSLGFGLVAGFAIPAGNSIVPLLVEERDLQAGNSVILGSTQLAGFVGPTLAGLLIGGLSKSETGVALAYGVDSLSFAVSAAALLLMNTGRSGALALAAEKTDGILRSIQAGMKFLWDDQAMRLMLVVVTAVNFLFIGPVLIGIPVLANHYLPEGAVAFGLLVSGVAGGNLIGYILAAQLPRPGGKFIRTFLLVALAAFGLAIMSLGFIRMTAVLFVIIFLLGLGNGYITILVLTWIQSRTPRAMLGRMMSMLMLTNTGVSPISQAVSGAVIKWSFPGLFLLAGAGLLLVPLWAAPQPGLKAVSEGLAINDHFEKELEDGDE